MHSHGYTLKMNKNRFQQGQSMYILCTLSCVSELYTVSFLSLAPLEVSLDSNSPVVDKNTATFVLNINKPVYALYYKILGETYYTQCEFKVKKQVIII